MMRASISNLLEESATGYWGVEPGTAAKDVKVVRNGDMKSEGGIRWEKLPSRSFSLAEVKKSRLRQGDIILTTSADCGQVSLIDNEPAELVCATNFVRILRFSPRVNPRYAFHYMRTRGFRDSLRPYIRGTTMKNLSTREAFPVVELPIPTLEEQERVAAILDHVDALRAKRRQALTHVESLEGAVYAHLLSSHDWPSFRLDEVASTTSGGTPNRAKPENYEGGISWVKSGELHSGLVTETSESISEVGLASSSAKLMPRGTVLIAMYGATAGVVSQLGIDAATNQAVCSITPGPGLNASYLAAALKSMSSQLRDLRSGGAQPNLSQTVIRALKIKVPPIHVQRKFEHTMVRVAKERQHVELAAATGDKLFELLQSRAFRGEL
ncbi:EcoKI restriction-modification system protein HsdS [Clavibacter michiganensis]|nr:EcoKI restriction-modification system protein HsdS [Clavibacter michiganensis]